MTTLVCLSATIANNGWVVQVNGAPGCVFDTYVFVTLADLAEWLTKQPYKFPNTEAKQ